MVFKLACGCHRRSSIIADYYMSLPITMETGRVREETRYPRGSSVSQLPKCTAFDESYTAGRKPRSSIAHLLFKKSSRQNDNPDPRGTPLIAHMVLKLAGTTKGTGRVREWTGYSRGSSVALLFIDLTITKTFDKTFDERYTASGMITQTHEELFFLHTIYY